MKVSIFTDASVRFKWCGYAFYIGCRNGKIQKAGRLKVRTSDSTIAELHCIANAIYTLKHSKFSPISKVFIYTDSDVSRQALSGLARFKDAETRKAVDEIHFFMIEVCIKHGRTMRDIDDFFKVTHVKAHTGSSDIYSRINDWCDKSAKQYAYPPNRPTKKKKAA